MNPLDTFCPGVYCGRIIVNGTLSQCGGCPRAFRSNSQHICVPCNEPLQLYDWIYLLFMVLVFVVIQCYFIDQSFKSNKLNFLSFSLYLATICESIIASIISTLPFNSGWDFNLRTCGVKSFADWYTLFFNPSINENFHCTQEAVYPLYSIVFIFYFIALCLVLSRHIYLRLICFILYFITRSNQVKRLYPKDCITKNTYYILYSIPALLFIHAILAGVIYYIFPFLILFGSVISITIHLSRYIDQSSLQLMRSIFQFRNFSIVLFHWSLHAFGVISLFNLSNTACLFLIFAVPLPTLFYISTTKFTDPSNI
ncbi:hypothetical protein BLOT_005067 [Blomia tropicalis]|nr:hypothetical protein BLOT_005067 [Blomia tropicalis]